MPFQFRFGEKNKKGVHLYVKRVFITAGQEAHVSIRLNADAFKVINEAGERVSEGKIVLYVGMGQPDERTKELTGHEAVKLEL